MNTVPVVASELEALLRDPQAQVIRYRSYGVVPYVLLFTAVFSAAVLAARKRQEMHCRRTTGVCLVQVVGPLSRSAREIALNRIVSAQIQVEERPRVRGPKLLAQRVQLLTRDGVVRLELEEMCQHEASCVETSQAADEIQRFLHDESIAVLDLSYGPFGSLWPLLLFLALALVTSLWTSEAIRVAVSADQERLIVERVRGWRRRYFELPLLPRLRCELGHTGRGRHHTIRVDLINETDERIQLTLGSNAGVERKRRFATELNATLTRAQARAV